MADFINVRCPACGLQSKVPSQTAGAPVRCTGCKKVFKADPGVAPPRSRPPGLPTVGAGATKSAGRGETTSDAPPSTSGSAIASLVCGLAFFVWPITPVLAIVLGVFGIRAAGRPGISGRRMATTGLILGCLGLVVTPVVVLPMLFNRAAAIANQAKCLSNMHQIGLAIMIYQQNNQGEYPPNLTVLVKESKIEPGVFVCPASKDTPATTKDDIETGGHCSYTYFGRGAANFGGNDVLLAENDADHAGGVNVLFTDGHAELETHEGARKMIEKAAADQANRDAHPAPKRQVFTVPGA